MEERRLRGGKKYLNPRSPPSISRVYEQRPGLVHARRHGGSSRRLRGTAGQGLAARGDAARDRGAGRTIPEGRPVRRQGPFTPTDSRTGFDAHRSSRERRVPRTFAALNRPNRRPPARTDCAARNGPGPPPNLSKQIREDRRRRRGTIRGLLGDISKPGEGRGRPEAGVVRRPPPPAGPRGTTNAREGRSRRSRTRSLRRPAGAPRTGRALRSVRPGGARGSAGGTGRR